MKYALWLRSTAFVAIALAAGCRKDQPSAADTFFPAEEAAATKQIITTQIARGARADATLHAIHFDDAALNSLGRDKLDAMIRDNSTPLPLVVYLDLPTTDPRTPSRTAAVNDYLTTTGLLAAQFQTHPGPNPATLHPTAPDLAALSKLNAPPTPDQKPTAADAPSSADSMLNSLGISPNSNKKP